MKKAILLLFLLYLGAFGEYVALWNDNDTTPLTVFPYKVACYPDTDQQALRQGIPISSLSEACRLWEDYFS